MRALITFRRRRRQRNTSRRRMGTMYCRQNRRSSRRHVVTGSRIWRIDRVDDPSAVVCSAQMRFTTESRCLENWSTAMARTLSCLSNRSGRGSMSVFNTSAVIDRRLTRGAVATRAHVDSRRSGSPLHRGRGDVTWISDCTSSSGMDGGGDGSISSSRLERGIHLIVSTISRVVIIVSRARTCCRA